MFGGTCPQTPHSQTLATSVLATLALSVLKVWLRSCEAAKQATDSLHFLVRTLHFKDICLPDLPITKTYDQFTESLKGYSKPKVLDVAETASITPSRVKMRA